MNIIIKNIFFTCALVCLYSIGFSQHHHHGHECIMPVDPHPKNKIQPDGEQITIKMFGDARMYYIETIDGYTITKDRKDGFYKYMTAGKGGDLFLTDIVVRSADNRSQKEQDFLNRTSKKLRVTGEALKEKKALQECGNPNERLYPLSADFPSIGVRKALMLLIDFPDQSATYTVNDIDRLLNEEGYNVNGQTGSFRDYYQDISYGKLTVNSDVKGWYRAANNKAFYGAKVLDDDGKVLNDADPAALVIEAIQAAEAEGVDFSEYDNDDDGIVDVVMVIHSGEGQEASSEEDDIWSHLAWIDYTTDDGVSMNQYIIQPEIYEGDDDINITNIGVVCHEFGHALGLPDLYVGIFSGQGFTGIGTWGLMGRGAGNNDLKTPAQMCVWSKARLGWITPTLITSPTSITNMQTTDVSPVCYRLNTATSTEYFLISARRQNGWDSGIDAEGLTVWHIDDTRNGNNLGRYIPQVYLLKSILSDGVFPGEDNDTDINDNAFPDNLNTYQQYDSGNCVSNISLTGTTPNLKASFDIDCAYDGAQYCMAVERQTACSDDAYHISNVTFSGINNSTSFSIFYNHADYVYDTPAIVSAASSHTLSVSVPDNNRTYFWRVWIDFNQDETFDNNTELVLDRANQAGPTISENVFIPADALKGETRMRVVVSTDNESAPLPCGNDFIFGEIEDYTIIICDDADNDGICTEDDCDDNNPDIPEEPGFACDDGNPNTTEDFIQIDGCTCVGYYPCVPFYELSGTINSAIFPAQDYIHADGQISAGSTVNFVAGNHVDLLPGFDAQGSTGTDFIAFIQQICSANKQETDKQQIAIRNYPNPFTGQTTIEFNVSKDTPVSLIISDAMGRQVEVLLDNEVKTEGTHLTTFDGSNYPTGMYYYTIRAGEYTDTQKMVLIK